MSKMIEDNIKEAKDSLNQAEQIGEIAYDICDGKLTNIKGFIHDENIWKKITEHEQKVFKEYSSRITKAKMDLKDVDPLFAWKPGMDMYMKLRHWKSLEMLNFYDKLVKEYGI